MIIIAHGFTEKQFLANRKTSSSTGIIMRESLLKLLLSRPGKGCGSPFEQTLVHFTPVGFCVKYG